MANLYRNIYSASGHNSFKYSNLHFWGCKIQILFLLVHTYLHIHQTTITCCHTPGLLTARNLL